VFRLGSEIWRHCSIGEWFLVLVRDGRANVAAGPLTSADDPRRLLEARGNQAHNPSVLLNMRRVPRCRDAGRPRSTTIIGFAISIRSPLYDALRASLAPVTRSDLAVMYLIAAVPLNLYIVLGACWQPKILRLRIAATTASCGDDFSSGTFAPETI
jgi:hypothetical protein